LDEAKIAQISDWRSSDIFDARERLALAFAEKLATDHLSIGDEFIAEMRAGFSDPEILELGMMIGQYIGFGRLLRVLDLENSDCPIK